MSSPITSVSAPQAPNLSQTLDASSSDQNILIRVEVRETVLVLRREELITLPESILLCLFPNGLMLDDQEEPWVQVDFDPDSLKYVIEFFRGALEHPPPVPLQNPALVPGKAAIIVLKEDLDFYIIPPRGSSPEQTFQLRSQAGNYLVSKASIFEGLRKQGGAAAGGSAEQHLIDMLCASGYDSEDPWARRCIEPQRACITSLALALLRPSHAANAVATSQKLLLFWRKPARKCWWDAMYLPESFSPGVSEVKIWARRVWTLELSIIG